MFKLKRTDIRRKIAMQLGHTLIDVELEAEEYDHVIDYALSIYRQRAENATKEQGIIFGFKKGQSRYDMSDREDIMDIIGIYRNGLGTTHSSGLDLDPFLLQFTNQMMTYAGGKDGYGSLATLDFQRQHLELLETIMAHQIQYYFNHSDNVLTIYNAIHRDEAFLIMAEVYRSDDELFNDTDICPWLVAYATAKAKQMLGEARGKFQQLAGPNGGISMNGAELKQEASEEIIKLEEDLKNLMTSTKGMPFIMF